MDATRLRELINAALEAQRVFDAAVENCKAAEKSRLTARDRCLAECGSLKSALSDSFALFGENVIRVGNDETGLRVFSLQIVNVPVLAPPPPPLPEASAPPKSERANTIPPNTVPAAPLAGGKIPDAAKKVGGK